jgi:hypothetical protein
VPIAKKYSLPLSDDAAEGMRTGRAFEERAFEEYDLDE